VRAGGEVVEERALGRGADEGGEVMAGVQGVGGGA
jgi:hypothetical protein